MTNADWATKDFYAVLGVPKDASAADVKKAYRKLARENHPDSNPGDLAKHDRFKQVAEAYDVVGDADKRKQYDEMRAAYAQGGFGFPGGFGGGGGGGQRINVEDLFGAGGAGGQRIDLGDLLGGMFGGAGQTRARAARPQRGEDVETRTTIGFTDAIEGVTVSLRLASDAPCATCHGTGARPGTQPKVCPECDGAGVVAAAGGGAFTMTETCPRCRGRQIVIEDPCPTCLGSGKGRSSRSIQARIPAGVKDGQRIRLRGKGGAGAHGGPAGDLFVVVSVSPHPLFGRKGDALTIDVPVTFDELVLGAEISVPTLNGTPVRVKVPPGTPNGRTFRVRGRGAPRSDGTRGDMLVTVEVTVPASLTAEQRRAVEAWREASAGSASSVRSNLFAQERS